MNDLQPVTFHGDTIFVVEHNNEPHVPMKPLIESMGLDWAGQYSKLNHNRKRWGIEKISTPSKSGRQSTICIPLRKLPGYLATINPNKVKNSLRAKIITYQNECDDALWGYWSTGVAIREKQHQISEQAKLQRPPHEMVEVELQAVKGVLAMINMVEERKNELSEAHEEVRKTFEKHRDAMNRLNVAYSNIHDVLWHLPFYANGLRTYQ